jgi:hypothetical protein
MKLIVLLFITLFLTSCETSVNEYEFLKPNKNSLANQVMAETAYQLKKEKNLIPFGTGARMMNQIEMLSLTFVYYEDIEIEEARKLLMEAIEVMTNVINSNEKIRPYLDQYPFGPSNLKISIFLDKPNLEHEFGKLSSCSMTEGKFEYKVRHSRYDFTTVLSETYEEAEKKLKTVDL